MKKLLCASGAIVSLMIAAPAFAQVTGYAGANYNHSEIDPGKGLSSVNDNGYAVSGAVLFPTAKPGLGVQLDGQIRDSDKTDTAVTGTAHLFNRNDSYLLGGFVGGSNSNGGNTWGLGVEGQKYLNDWTVAGAAGYGRVDRAHADVWAVRADARYFVNENFRLEGNVGYNNLDLKVGGSADAWGVGVGGEYQFAQAPVSVFAKYDYAKVDNYDIEANVFRIGARWNFGGTLKSRDRSGASLGGFSDMIVGNLF
ncbi:MAG: outer membrane beta-barrel protein [Caulobacteraceae bacterium]|nr:outer membrane beta-barrel protein [Caulobacteraceae bacterium]